MKRCVLVVADAGPLNSLWVADRLDLLLLLDMPIVVVDAVYEEVTSDPNCLRDAEVKAFIDGNTPPFVVASTFVGALERQQRRPGMRRRKNTGELAMMDFISEEGGVQRYLETGDPVLVLFEDQELTVLRQPENMDLLSTVGMLRSMERVGLIDSADVVIHEMTHPSARGRRREDAREF